MTAKELEHKVKLGLGSEYNVSVMFIPQQALKRDIFALKVTLKDKSINYYVESPKSVEEIKRQIEIIKRDFSGGYWFER